MSGILFGAFVHAATDAGYIAARFVTRDAMARPIVLDGEGRLWVASGLTLTTEAEPPTDPSALAAWLYARVVPGQTIAETPGRRFVVLAVDMSMDGKRVFLDERNGYAIPQATQHPITRLLNPDGTVLWEARR